MKRGKILFSVFLVTLFLVLTILPLVEAAYTACGRTYANRLYEGTCCPPTGGHCGYYLPYGDISCSYQDSCGGFSLASPETICVESWGCSTTSSRVTLDGVWGGDWDCNLYSSTGCQYSYQTISCGQKSKFLNSGSHTICADGQGRVGNFAGVYVYYGIIDTTIPSVSVSHSPSSPGVLDNVGVSASASDTGGNMNKIEIYLDGNLKKTCSFSPTSSYTCSTDSQTYGAGSHNYYAKAYDSESPSNIGTSSTGSFTVTAQCTSGDCCTYPPGVFKPSGTICKSGFGYRCSSYDCGGDVLSGTWYYKCNGISSGCYQWSHFDGSVFVACSETQKCNATSGTCVTASECMPTPPPVICGDGVIGTGETCDDGNTNPGDGCNSTCGIESGWECIGEPSVCNPISGPPVDCTLFMTNDTCLAIGNDCTWTPPRKEYPEAGCCFGGQADPPIDAEEWDSDYEECGSTANLCYLPFNIGNIITTKEESDLTKVNIRFDRTPAQYCAKVFSEGINYGFWYDTETY